MRRVLAPGRRRAHLGAAALVWVSLTASTACVHVAPYERGALARPDMTPSDLAGRAERHVVTIHEGAARSGAVGEAGCGCN